MRRAFVPLFGLALLWAAGPVGTAPAAPVPKHLMRNADPLYFPTTVGTKWVYALSGQELIYEITGVETGDGDQLVTVAGGVVSPTVWRVSKSGVFIVSMGKQTCDPQIPMLRLPLADNKKWDAKKAYETAPDGRFAAHGPEEIEVGAGTFRAIRVEVEWVGSTKVTFWYAPGVGVVKAAGALEKELKSFTPGKG